MIRRPPRSTRVRSSAASDVYKRQIFKGQYSFDDISLSGLSLDIRKYSGEVQNNLKIVIDKLLSNTDSLNNQKLIKSDKIRIDNMIVKVFEGYENNFLIYDLKNLDFNDFKIDEFKLTSSIKNLKLIFNDTATTEIYTRKIVGSVRCV